jgi:hypothetical protein
MNVLVIGPAKTGTTVISKAIQYSLGDADYHLEPKRIRFFEQGPHVESERPQVVKLIFEHWEKTPRMRNAVVHNEATLKFDKVVCTVRDPRDELLSRMLYVILPYTNRHGYCPDVVGQWVALLQRKERAPREVSVSYMLERFEELAGVRGLAFVFSLQRYSQFLKANSKRVFVLRYEDFMQGRLDALEAYLGIKLSDQRDVGDLSRVTRTRAFDNWKRWFTPEDVVTFRDRLATVMQDFGYEDWELEQPEALDPEHGSLYVLRLIEGYADRLRI